MTYHHATSIPLRTYARAIGEATGDDVRIPDGTDPNMVPNGTPMITAPDRSDRFVVITCGRTEGYGGHASEAKLLVTPFVANDVQELYRELVSKVPRIWRIVEAGRWHPAPSQSEKPKPRHVSVHLPPKQAEVYVAALRLTPDGEGIPDLPERIAERFGKRAGWHVTELRQKHLLKRSGGLWFVERDRPVVGSDGKPLSTNGPEPIEASEAADE